VYEDAAVAQWGLKNCLSTPPLAPVRRPAFNSRSTHLFLVPLGGDFIELVAPIKDGTTAGKLLEKRGDGGYMIIMQTEDAKTRREYLKKQGMARVIFTHDYGDVVCTQYHPKGIKGKLTKSQHHRS
jgi:hypothetical protein